MMFDLNVRRKYRRGQMAEQLAEKSKKKLS
jgi:hypothetical protein